MPRQDEIDRMILMFYISRNSHGFINYTAPCDWLDKLPMAGLEELIISFENKIRDVREEIELRNADGMPRYSRRWHESQEAERAGGAALLSDIGVRTERE